MQNKDREAKSKAIQEIFANDQNVTLEVNLDNSVSHNNADIANNETDANDTIANLSKIVSQDNVDVSESNIPDQSLSFKDILPIKLIVIFLGLYLFSLILNKYTLNISPLINISFLFFKSAVYLSSILFNLLIFATNLINLAKIVQANLGINPGLTLLKIKQYAGISIALIILTSFLNIFNVNFAQPTSSLYLTTYQNLVMYLSNNLLYLQSLKILTVFSDFCVPRLLCLTEIFTLSWLFIYFKPIYSYYRKFASLFGFKELQNKNYVSRITGYSRQQLLKIHKLYYTNINGLICLNVLIIVMALFVKSIVLPIIFFCTQLIFWYEIITFVKLIRHLKLNKIESKIYPSLSNDIIIPYKLESGLEKWFWQRFNQPGSKKKILIIIILILTCFSSIGNYLLIALSKFTNLLNLANGSGYKALAPAQIISNLQVLSSLFFLILICIILSFWYLRRLSLKPTLIKINSQGIAFGRSVNDIKYVDEIIYWQNIKNIRIDNAPKNILNKTLVFDINTQANIQQNIHNGVRTWMYVLEGLNSVKPSNEFKINLNAITDFNHRELILKAIEKYGNQIPRDASVIEMLQTPSEHSYTDIWLQALASPPKRNSLKPLEMDCHLKDLRYRVIGYLASGGQGSTYVAYDSVLNQEVVLKEFILPVFVDLNVRKDALTQFEAEAKILKKINHPQIVTLIDYFTQDHRAYLVLEYIQGVTLKEIILRDGFMEENKVINISIQLLKVLQYLHHQNPSIIHRDLTPDNILLQTNGDIKIIDFNVAKQSNTVTIVSKVVGKHAYMPPEQFQGTVSTQSDIYSFGATMSYLLTGHEPTPISAANPQKLNNLISDKINNIVLKATALKLANRYEHVQDILTEIETLS